MLRHLRIYFNKKAAPQCERRVFRVTDDAMKVALYEIVREYETIARTFVDGVRKGQPGASDAHLIDSWILSQRVGRLVRWTASPGHYHPDLNTAILLGGPEIILHENDIYLSVQNPAYYERESGFEEFARTLRLWTAPAGLQEVEPIVLRVRGWGAPQGVPTLFPAEALLDAAKNPAPKGP